MQRAEYLDTTKDIICKERQDVHGAPENTFALIAQYWSTYLGQEFGKHVEVADADVAIMMALLKVARLQMNAHNDDNIIDGIGYLAIAGELISQVQGSEEVLNEK